MKETEISGNFYNKYESRNPIEKKLMKGFFDTAAFLISKAEVNSLDKVLETGCGEGHFSDFLRSCVKDSPIDAFDIAPECIDKAKSNYSERSINFYVNNVYDPGIEENSYSLVCASEMLEHVENPVLALKSIEKISSKYVFLSVPNEPLWCFLNMCRFKYLKRLGNTPGHIQHWNQTKFLKMVEQNTHLKCLYAKKSLPWLLFLFEKV